MIRFSFRAVNTFGMSFYRILAIFPEARPATGFRITETKPRERIAILARDLLFAVLLLDQP